ncbi:BrnA antitoxin family protein [Solirhodobacter olei]|uniref:BrnA antitoxin family protein n=1 Tax=Solirhodobacter olei TaxID=2493082 RepID=UPI000FD74885|nr:BrnA antitoxin family protein [Solirhodobacter olei]
MADAPPKMSEKKLEYYYFMSVAQKRVEWEIANTLWRGWGLPAAWNEIGLGPREGKREKVTLYLDESVMKFFRAMGRGVHPRINDVLKIWMYGRLMRLIHGPEHNELFGPEGLFATKKPEWDEAYDGDEQLVALARSFGRKGV